MTYIAPANRPNEAPQEAEIQLIADVRRAVDVLTARPEVDPQRLGYVGHSYGATYGGVVAGVERRIQVFVLMAAGYVSVTHSYRVSAHHAIAQERAAMEPEQWERFLRLIEPLDAVHYIGQAAPAAVFLQFALHDEFVTAAEWRRYEQAASDPKQACWYECGHAFNAEARQDRERWLSEELVERRAHARGSVRKVPVHGVTSCRMQLHRRRLTPRSGCCMRLMRRPPATGQGAGAAVWRDEAPRAVGRFVMRRGTCATCPPQRHRPPRMIRLGTSSGTLGAAPA